MTAPSALLLALALPFALLPAQDSVAQVAAPDAREHIRRALDALGGEERIRAIQTIEIQGTGAEYRGAEVQGWSPAKPTRTDHRETLVADFAHARVSHEYKTGRHDGSTRWRRFIYAGEERAWVEFSNRIADRGPHPRAAEDRRELFRRIPTTCCSRRGSIPTGWKGWRIPA
jgi:hypothetical protein